MCIIVAPDDVKVMYAVRTLRRGSLSFLSVDNAPIPEQLSAKTADLKNLLADFRLRNGARRCQARNKGFVIKQNGGEW